MDDHSTDEYVDDGRCHQDDCQQRVHVDLQTGLLHITHSQFLPNLYGDVTLNIRVIPPAPQSRELNSYVQSQSELPMAIYI